MYWYGDAPHWWMFALMILFAVPLWITVALAIIALGRVDRTPEHPSRDEPTRLSPDALLAERFASGDFEETEYRHRLAVLHATTAPKPGNRLGSQHGPWE